MLGSTLPTSWTGEFDVAVRFGEDSAKCLLTATGSTDWPGTEIYGLKLEKRGDRKGASAHAKRSRRAVLLFFLGRFHERFVLKGLSDIAHQRDCLHFSKQ